jgi:hypothetical protein
LELDRTALSDAAADPGFGALALEVGRQLCARAGTERWGLQEALLEFEAESVFGHFADARILYLVRDPRDRVISMSRDGALGAGGAAAEAAAWVSSARVALTAREAWPGGFHIVSYEELLAEPERVLRAVCRFIGEDYATRMAEVEPLTRRARMSETPPESSPGGRLMRDVALVEERAAEEMGRMGYDRMPVAPRAGIIRDRLVDASRWQLGRMAWWKRSRHLGRNAAPRRD